MFGRIETVLLKANFRKMAVASAFHHHQIVSTLAADDTIRTIWALFCAATQSVLISVAKNLSLCVNYQHCNIVTVKAFKWDEAL